MDTNKENIEDNLRLVLLCQIERHRIDIIKDYVAGATKNATYNEEILRLSHQSLKKFLIRNSSN